MPPGYGYLTRHLPRKVTRARLSGSATDRQVLMLKIRGKKHYFIPKCSGLSSHKEQTNILGITMVSRLRHRQRPRRFLPTCDRCLVLEAVTSCLKKVPLQTGLRLHSRRNELPPHQKACGITNSRRLAGDHCTSSDSDLLLGQLDSCSDCLRANTAAKRPSLTSPYEGREPAIKAKEPEVRSAGGTDDLVGRGNRFGRGSLTYGDHHLSTDDSGHLPTNTAPANGGCPNEHRQVLTHILASGMRTGPSQNTNTALAAYDVLCNPLVQPAAREGPGRGWPAHGATDTRAADGQPLSGTIIRGTPKTPNLSW
jgi:hypothetical protein